MPEIDDHVINSPTGSPRRRQSDHEVSTELDIDGDAVQNAEANQPFVHEETRKSENDCAQDVPESRKKKKKKKKRCALQFVILAPSSPCRIPSCCL
jgi:hypothetical protein